MPAFVSLLAIIVLKIPLVNSQIADAPPNINKWSVRNIINKINFHFATIILANSYAGLKAYKAENKKSKVIYNGVYLDRFSNLPDKNEIRSKYQVFFNLTVTMVAAFYENKDYDLFIEIAKIINLKRNDVSFLAVGNGINLEKIKKRVFDGQIQNVIFTGKIDDVESLVNLADIGVLFSPNGEGISNAIIEYMALGKPVIANDAGGTKEIVKHGVNGYLITTETAKEIANLVDTYLMTKRKDKKWAKPGKSKSMNFLQLKEWGKNLKRFIRRQQFYL